jgi:hypothetical protein
MVIFGSSLSSYMLARADKYFGEFVLEREWNIEVEPAN